MNERIKNLLSQANIYDGRDSLYWCEEKNLIEFAELIVGECANICYSDYANKQPLPSDGFDLARKIEEHFGVE